MQINFNPKTNTEIFCNKVYKILVENSVQTFLVGGTARDLVLYKNFIDSDISTNLKPKQVQDILKKNKIQFSSEWEYFGVVVAKEKKFKVEISTFRKDKYTKTRYPKVQFVNSPKEDSQRRDFTINSLYFSPKNNKIYDFKSGLVDLQNKQIKFIGNPQKKILEDPLRIVRALRFALDLNFILERKTFFAIKKNFGLINSIPKKILKKEILKCKHKKTLLKILKLKNIDSLLFLM